MTNSRALSVQYRTRLGDQTFDIDLELPNRGITAIFGRSGAGKTSLIHSVAGLHTPLEGRIQLNDRVLFCSQNKINVPVHQRNVGYVFQEARLFPHYRVEGNLLYGVKGDDKAHFDKVVDTLDLSALLSRYPKALSGGEKQRVAIGRALLRKPDILLMDEPLASLDMPRKREVMPYLEQLAADIDVPILYVSHSLNEVLRLADQLVVIDDGRVVACDKIEAVWSSDVMRPWHSFSEQSSLFEARVLRHNHHYALTEVSLTPSHSLWVQKINAGEDDLVRLQIRANDVSLALEPPKQTSIRNSLKVTIEELEEVSHGDQRQSVTVYLRLDERRTLKATITQWAKDELNLTPGMTVYAQIKGVSVTQKDIALAHGDR
ncbi:molybdenum ABC transporter ATP-binding protein ModC [Vibrio cholerae]